ncbi:UPF0696 protein-like protein [Lachnellula willkommii]|uniref:UPF0696 protein-like protein n=1 Tax=Lachnellula willkommii TaxID=215461 RepID=A0A559LZ85_9HELO|nr:UPF0696 protein-like protein [Lachnellula willkommii]
MAIRKEVKVVEQEEMAYLSDDSSFYGTALATPLFQAHKADTVTSGDEAVQQDLEERASSFNPAEWWEHMTPSLTETASANLASATVAKAPKLYNPYEGNPCGRQLAESVDEFLHRLPPASTPASSRYPWIFIANPYRKAPKPNNEGELAEGPPDDDSQWARFVVEGGNLLEELLVLKNKIEKEKAGSTKATVTKALNVQRNIIVEKLLDIAVEMHCTSGKVSRLNRTTWMIFCPPEEVNDVWAVVARATASNDLGIAAKVARDNGEDQRPRLICIYTKDFSDRGDVTRVVQKLKDLGLVETRGSKIYYKCDAYTFLGLGSKNEYQIQASLYNSGDFLGSKKQDSKGKTSGYFYKKKDHGDWKSVEYE